MFFSMTTQEYQISFDGYWREINKRGLPPQSGVFCVYACVYQQTNNKVMLRRLIYIGAAEDVNFSLANHENLAQWERMLVPEEELCYSFGAVGFDDRLRCEAAMIRHHKPLGNRNGVDRSIYPPTTIKLSGCTKFLDQYFTVG